MSHFSKLTALLLCCTALFSACKKDSSGGDIVGTWNLTEISCADGKTTTTVAGTSISADFTFTGKNYNATVTFKSDGTYTSSGTYTQVLTTTTGGTAFTQEIALDAFSGSGTWEEDGDHLHFKDSAGNESEFEITEQTDAKLRMKTLLNSTQNQGGAVVTQKATIFYAVEK